MSRRSRPVVIDTNVPLAAHGAASAGADCASRCARAVERVMTKGRLVLDETWFIVAEYRDNLNLKGQPGVAQAFLKWVLTNHANGEVCVKVKISVRPGSSTDFEEFPRGQDLSDFDARDRKFVAVSLAYPQRATILQAVDSKWWARRDALTASRVRVEFLCTAEVHAASARKAGGRT